MIVLPFVTSVLLTASGDATDVLVDIGGRRLHLTCAGTGLPAVILEAGFGESSTTWTSVQPAIAEVSRVCSYDRAGRGTSDPDHRSEPRTSRSAVDDLHALLESAAVAGPYVLVGHSLGGAYVRSYAQRFPKSVVGLVLIDATHEDQLVRRRAAGYSPPPLPSPTDNVERTDLLAVLEETREAGWRADIPLVVLAAEPSEPGAYPGASAELVARLDAVWVELQRELAGRSSKGRLVIAHGSGHYIHRDAPEVVIEAIRDVVNQVRKQAGHAR